MTTVLGLTTDLDTPPVPVGFSGPALPALELVELSGEEMESINGGEPITLGTAMLIIGGAALGGFLLGAAISWWANRCEKQCGDN